jgi:uncharacterized membrane protein YqgA involved in biofilm formation
MIGTALNAAGILVGGTAGLLRPKPLSPATESFWKVTLGVFTVFYGLRLTWQSLNGSFSQILKQLLIAILALSLGRWTGWLLRLQTLSNRLGRTARERINAEALESPKSPNEGFKLCAVIFCASPLGIVGAVEDGVGSYYYPLAVKAVMDGLAAMGLARLFGWSVTLAALPVLAFQGTITLVCAGWVGPFLHQHGLTDAVNATAGLLIFSVALVILQLKKVALADYLPSLVYAALIKWLWP